MGICRSSYYYWRKRLTHPADRTRAFISNIMLFKEYHERYPSHGYRWLNAKIRLDTGLIVSDPYAHKCCKAAGIKSQSKHYKYKKPGHPFKVYPNLLLSELNATGPMQCIVSDMTAFSVKGIYYELTIYMDLWNNEIVSHSLSSRRGDRMTYWKVCWNSRRSIRTFRQYFILTRAQYILLKHSMRCFLRII